MVLRWGWAVGALVVELLIVELLVVEVLVVEVLVVGLWGWGWVWVLWVLSLLGSLQLLDWPKRVVVEAGFVASVPAVLEVQAWPKQCYTKRTSLIMQFPNASACCWPHGSRCRNGC